MVAMSLIIPISILALIVFVVVFFVSAKGSNKEGDEGGESVIKSMYIYLVLFATLMMVIGGSVSAFMAAADIVAPAPYYQSFEDFKRFEIEGKGHAETETEFAKPTDSELRERYDIMIKEDQIRQLGRAKNSLIKSFGWIIIPLIIFVFFQRKLVKKADN